MVQSHASGNGHVHTQKDAQENGDPTARRWGCHVPDARKKDAQHDPKTNKIECHGNTKEEKVTIIVQANTRADKGTVMIKDFDATVGEAIVTFLCGPRSRQKGIFYCCMLSVSG